MTPTSLYLAAMLLAASPVRSDETVVLFPTAARFDAAQDAWVGEIHGWIYEPEEDSNWRGDLVEALEEAADFDEFEEDRELFRSRVMPFLADNERGKQLDVRIADRVVHCENSSPNGHFFGAFKVPRAAVVDGVTRLPIEIVLDEDDERSFTSEVFLVPGEGVSVISDIDDTIKVSNVTDKVELLRNTFARPFTAVPGMPECYQTLAERGAAFHYVSASPWQLYSPLEAFRTDAKFPAGTYDMKSFRIWDESWRNLTADSAQIKTPAIEKLLQAYPKRKFLLIGDSGESDPEIYGAIARRFPEQILGIAIRSVREGESLSDERFQEALKDVPVEKLLLFKSADELAAQFQLWWP
jgi:hypothetical protein